MLTSQLGLALAGLTAWGLYGYLFTRERRITRSGKHGVSAGDRELCGTIRAAIETSGVVSNPRALRVRAQNGYVTLSGDVFWAEANGVMSLVRALPHVKGVRNRLSTHRSAAGVSSLQGRPFPASRA